MHHIIKDKTLLIKYIKNHFDHEYLSKNLHMPVITTKNLCLDDQIRNPKTKRCLKLNGKAAITIINQLDLSEFSEEDQIKINNFRNSLLNKKKGNTNTCLDDQIRNPKTKRCIKLNGKAAITLINQLDLSEFSKEDQDKIQQIRTVVLSNKKKKDTSKCTDKDQIRNPKTKRCIKINGKAAITLINQLDISEFEEQDQIKIMKYFS